MPEIRGLSYKVTANGEETTFTFSVNWSNIINDYTGFNVDGYPPPPSPFEYGTNLAEFMIEHNYPQKIIFTNGNYLQLGTDQGGVPWASDGMQLYCRYYFYLANGKQLQYTKYDGSTAAMPCIGYTQRLNYGDGTGKLSDGAGLWAFIGLGNNLDSAKCFGWYAEVPNHALKPSDWYPTKPDLTGYVYTDPAYAKTYDEASENTRATYQGQINALKSFLAGAEVTPYYGETSTTGGGDGTYTIINDPIDFAPLPTISAVSSGLVSLYSPNAEQINALANFLWSEDFFVNVAKTFNNPIDMIIGLSIFPVTPPILGTQAVKIGNIASTVSMNRISQQFITVDCGSIDVKEYWGSALDYAPFSKISIFLPYIGTKELNIDDIMSRTIHLRYTIDLLTGSCNAEIKCGDSVLYSYTGVVNSPIPITGTDWSGLTRSLISAVVGTGVAVATGGTGAAIAAGIAGAANSVINSKPNVQKTGALSGTSGLLSQQTPYLIYELPRQSRAENYNATMGLPSNIYAKLSTLKGFTKLSKIHMEKLSATAAEAAEIEKLLYEGVIL